MIKVLSDYTGNRNISSDILRMLMALKQNVMNDSHCTEVYQVVQAKDDGYICRSVTDGSSAQVISSHGLAINIGDVVLVQFADVDFRQNLTRIKANLTPIYSGQDATHSRSFGIITTIVYRKEETEG